MTRLLTPLLTGIMLITLNVTALAGSALPITPTPPPIDARAFVLMDAYSGKILASNNIDEKMPPASLTKLMTLFIISQAINEGTIKLDDKVQISKKAWQMGGSKMFVKVGDNVLVSDLIQGIVVDSGNDASVAMAEYIAGSEESFVSLMNAQAHALGMTSTHFTDATGLTQPEHYSTARDLALLARIIATQYPEEYQWYSQKSFTYANIKQSNRNRLLWHYEFADGLKTGHTDAAQYCLVASAKKGDMRLITVVLGAPSDNIRTYDSKRLFTYGFRFFETVKLFDPNVALTKARVYFGRDGSTDVGVTKTVYLTVPARLAGQLNTHFTVKNNPEAPILKGDILGEATITAEGNTLEVIPLVALNPNERGSLWSNAVDQVELAWKKWV